MSSFRCLSKLDPNRELLITATSVNTRPLRNKSKGRGGLLTVTNTPCLLLGLMVFPKPQTALEYTFSMSEPQTYKKLVEDLESFLKRKCAGLEGGGELVLTQSPVPCHAMTAFRSSIFRVCFTFLFFPFQAQTAGKICK